jgi:7-carboxy-7-deazaguanine synthase
MRISEIFSSIDGEGHHAGGLASFVRFSGCNLKCSYCDSAYACDPCNTEELTIDEIMKEIIKRGNKYVTLTGGEPLLQSDLIDLVDRLHKSGYAVNIETNGSLPLKEFVMRPCVITMDVKTPASRMQAFNFYKNIEILRNDDVIKFVVMPKEDAEFVYNILREYKPKCKIYLSPIFGISSLLDCVNLLRSLKDRLDLDMIDRVKVQVQLHKIAGVR